MSVLFYRRPSYVDRPVGPLNQKDCQKYVERMRNHKNAVPPELSFERVINDETLPPCSLNDFMAYLSYVAFDAETLQFYLWFQDYTKRFSALRKEERALSPEWKPSIAMGDERKPRARASVASLRNIDVEKANSTDVRLSQFAPGAFADPPTSPTINDYESWIAKSVQSHRSISEMANEANTQAGLKWQAFTCQPFRPEIAKVIAHYFAPNAPRELNISHRDKSAVLHALQHTTHPSAFQIVNTVVEGTLRGQLHPNFIRWSICNGNKPKVYFVRLMGVSHIALGILIALLMTLSSISRWYRLLSAPVTLLGIFTMVAAYKGLCVILHASGRVRNLRPWEDADSVFTDNTPHIDDEEAAFTLSDAHSIAAKSIGSKKSAMTTSLKRPKSFDTFGTSNSYTDEPWVTRYEKRPLTEKVFEKSTWVQDEAVRLVQDKIIQQSQIWGLVLTTIITAFFVALPQGNFY